MIKNYFDIIIIGAGVSGLILANEIIERTDKSVLVLEKKRHLKDTKNLCFWNKPNNILVKNVDNRWRDICVLINHKKIKLKSEGIEYLRIKSNKLFSFFVKKLKRKKKFKLLLNQKISSLKNKNSKVRISSNGIIYNTSLVFDSRVNHILENDEKLFQHFYGVELTLDKDLINHREVVLMDIQKKKRVFNFFYILPMGKKRVFIETTYFSSKVLKKKYYNKDIKNYLKKKFDGYKYKIESDELGIIPMFKYKENNSDNHIKIGTAGNWVRQATGYSVQNCFKNSKEIVDCLVKNKKPQITENKFINFLDKTFCIFLKNDPDKISLFFEKFFKENKLPLLVNFLTSSASFIETIRIIISLPKMLLIKSLFFNK